MKLAQPLLQLRRQRELSQKTVAAGCGISRQTYNGYETGQRYPRGRATYERMARFFDVDVHSLLGEHAPFVTDASDRYGPHGMAQARARVGELAGMFAGGELTEEDKVAVMRSLEQAFWLAKEENKKYAPKRFRK